MFTPMVSDLLAATDPNICVLQHVLQEAPNTARTPRVTGYAAMQVRRHHAWMRCAFSV
jgi:hypothetical protein